MKVVEKTNNDFNAVLDIINKENITWLETLAKSLPMEDDVEIVLIKMMVIICKEIEEANERCFICQKILE
jgi:hypothetical protein